MAANRRNQRDQTSALQQQQPVSNALLELLEQKAKPPRTQPPPGAIRLSPAEAVSYLAYHIIENADLTSDQRKLLVNVMIDQVVRAAVEEAVNVGRESLMSDPDWVSVLSLPETYQRNIRRTRGQGKTGGGKKDRYRGKHIGPQRLIVFTYYMGGYDTAQIARILHIRYILRKEFKIRNFDKLSVKFRPAGNGSRVEEIRSGDRVWCGDQLEVFKVTGDAWNMSSKKSRYYKRVTRYRDSWVAAIEQATDFLSAEEAANPEEAIKLIMTRIDALMSRISIVQKD